MGSLLAETPHSEITATMEVLARWGVEREDLKAFRGAATVVQQRIAEGFTACKLGQAEALRALAGDAEARKGVEEASFEPSESETAAREIMGKNMFGIADAIKHFKSSPTEKELSALEKIPFSEATLRECANTHILVADFGLSVVDVWEQHTQLFYSKANPWYSEKDQAKWARKCVKAQWRLLRKTAVKDSFSKDFHDQEALLGKGEEVPEAREMVCMVIGHYLASREKLFPDYYVRTKSLSGAGDRIRIGCFDSDGLRLRCWYGGPDNDVGLASSGSSL